MKIIRLRTTITVILEDGTTIVNSKCTDEMYSLVMDNQDNEDAVLNILVPEYVEARKKDNYVESISNSNIITFEGNKAYIEDISSLIVPIELVEAILIAEQEGDHEAIEGYKNFWTLCSLNPNAEARKNLFWFLNKYGMKISKSGLFVTYRNVALKNKGTIIDTEKASFISTQWARVKYKLKKSPKNYYFGLNSNGEYAIHLDSSILKSVEGSLDYVYSKLADADDSPVYTDTHSRTFEIKIGIPVTMDRSKCDENSSITCSRGLHVAGKDWLAQGYYGDVSLMCLVNPADVVAVPPLDNYGKMRTCAYYPVKIVERDDQGYIINDEYPDGFEDDFMNLISYEGTKNNTENLSYTLNVPVTPEINRTNIMNKLKDIKKALGKKYVD